MKDIIVGCEAETPAEFQGELREEAQNLQAVDTVADLREQIASLKRRLAKEQAHANQRDHTIDRLTYDAGVLKMALDEANQVVACQRAEIELLRITSEFGCEVAA